MKRIIIKVYFDNRADPKSIRNLLAGGGTVEFKDASGNVQDTNKMMNDIKKEVS